VRFRLSRPLSAKTKACTNTEPAFVGGTIKPMPETELANQMRLKRGQRNGDRRGLGNLHGVAFNMALSNHHHEGDKYDRSAPDWPVE
jgi:hypothetical protein